jgi:hypothetical protein
MFGIIEYRLSSEGGLIKDEDPSFLFLISDFLSSSSSMEDFNPSSSFINDSITFSSSSTSDSISFLFSPDFISCKLVTNWIPYLFVFNFYFLSVVSES